MSQALETVPILLSQRGTLGSTEQLKALQHYIPKPGFFFFIPYVCKGALTMCSFSECSSLSAEGEITALKLLSCENGNQ